MHKALELLIDYIQYLHIQDQLTKYPSQVVLYTYPRVGDGVRDLYGEIDLSRIPFVQADGHF